MLKFWEILDWEGGIKHFPSSQPGQPRGTFGIEWSKWLPPVTSRTFLSHYLPASGAVSHTLYTVHLFSPNIISSLFPTGDLAISNTILFNANVGLGFYVYFRRHLHRVNPWERVEFSVLASTLFNFGSLLAAVLIKALFPAKSPTWLKSLTATVLSAYLLTRANKYMGLLDTRTTSRSSVSPARSMTSRRMNVRSVASASPYSPQQTSPTPMLLPMSQIQSQSPPSRSDERSYTPMTPSATELTASDFGEETAEDDLGSTKQNYRYLHSYALNNLNHSRPKKESILRRTTMNRQVAHSPKQSTPRRPSETVPVSCFVTPEPSLRELEVGVYTPPPSRVERPNVSEKRRRMKKMAHERDEFDRVLDVVQLYGPLALVPFAVGCFVTGTVPMYNTIRFIFA
uniref:PDZ domain-containing protein n=1 Tax=Caenorhabditis japonica TaxID=281687 RepID=A0A8R1HN46_CAEJA